MKEEQEFFDEVKGWKMSDQKFRVLWMELWVPVQAPRNGSVERSGQMIVALESRIAPHPASTCGKM